MIELRALGTAEIHTEQGMVAPSQRIVFATGLYLIVERGASVTRTRLSSLLWPNIPRRAQAHRLRQTLYQLKTLGIAISADRDFLKIARDGACTDFDRVGSIGLTLPEESNSLVFLPGYAPSLSEEFERWLDSLRERVNSALTLNLVAQLRQARTAADWNAVERISRVCLHLDSYNEAAVLARAEAFAMRGQKSTAMAILDAYSNDLGPEHQSLALPVSILRRRVLQHDDRPPNAPTVSQEPEFVGRRAEMAVLTRMIDDARKGLGKGCLIDGEPGIGKTRLSAELAKFAELQGLRVERVSCKRPDADQPLSAFVTLVPRLRELPGALGCSHPTFAWLKRLTEVEVSSSDLSSAEEDSATLYTRLRSAVFDLLDAISDESCLLIIVEDVQWLDHASAKLFGAILEWMASKKILILFNSRETRNPLTSVVSGQRLQVVHLTRLASDDARTLMHLILAGAAGAPEELGMDWLIETGDGNPYFLQELAKYWIESGRKRDIPPSIASVLDERLSRLSPVARQLLQACAVLGEHCSLGRLERVFDYPPQDLLMGVQELSVTGMLRSESGENESQGLAIRHDLLSIEVLKALAPTSLAFLHRRCGSVLEHEVLGPSISISLMRACAFHWYHSGDSERAFGLAIKCADHLLEIGLATDAAVAFEGALGFSSNPMRQLDVLRRIIQAHRMAADRGALLTAIKRLRSLEDSGSPSSHHDDIEILEFETLRTTEADLRPVLVRTVRCVSDASLPAVHRVNVAVAAMKTASSVVDLGEMGRLYREVEPLLADSTVDVRSRLQIQVIYHTMCGDLSRGLTFARERLAFERAYGLTASLLNAMFDLSFVLRRTGPPEEMFAVLHEAYGTAIEHKDYAAARDAAGKLGSLLEDEELPGSKEWMERAVENGKLSDEIHGSFSFNADSARIALRENRLDDARRILDNGFDWEWLRPRQMWLAAAYGLRIRLSIAERVSAAEVGPDVGELRRLYETFAGLGRQDYEIVGLARGLIYIGHNAQATQYVTDFVSGKRRDLVPLSHELRSLVEELRVTPNRAMATNPAPIGPPVAARMMNETNRKRGTLASPLN